MGARVIKWVFAVKHWRRKTHLTDGHLLWHEVTRTLGNLWLPPSLRGGSSRQHCISQTPQAIKAGIPAPSTSFRQPRKAVCLRAPRSLRQLVQRQAALGFATARGDQGACQAGTLGPLSLRQFMQQLLALGFTTATGQLCG